ncbi:putative potassium ion channel yvc1 protein [Zalerion maritima]|uniref:Potassium ion channel yvc1 protein n=1 Tax=Zalerion maritima TaxID=339359 RepID=A0AAD5RUM5_9PEZI|nr:putative potassium ion channel yvc1 protein [Zalerion maritima]
MPSLFSWKRMFGWDKHPRDGHHGYSWFDESRQALLPSYRGENVVSAIAPPEVTKVCLRLRHLIEECIPCELEEDAISKPHSKIITEKVVKAAREAGGEEYSGCIVFCLLVNKRWFHHQSLVELWDAELHEVRAVACEVIAKRLIEGEEDQKYLLHTVLLKRYSILVDGHPTPPTSVIEKAVDLHAVRVIGSSGYQKCISYLWKGWLVQDEDDPSTFIEYQDRDNTNLLIHFDPDRMRAPLYQNTATLLISIIYLVLYTIAINSINPEADIDFVEWLLYVFTAGFVVDEIVKLYKVGYRIVGFWNALNWSLYAFLIASLVLRFLALTHAPNDALDGPREHYNTMSYNCLAFCAPFFWIRLMLYLDSFRFFGAMLVVLKVMMKESLIFFALLAVVIIGFLQAFIGLDFAKDNHADATLFIIQRMIAAILQSPEFDGFDRFSSGPFALTLYYIFTFIVMVILLNVLIALYNSAYEDIYDNANDEFMAMFSHKTIQFVRAPDENVYIPPFNLVEIFLSVIPFEWWMPKDKYEKWNDILMFIIYSPLLLIAALFERGIAVDIRNNRRRGEEDDDIVEEWEQMSNTVDFEADGWSKTVAEVKSNVEDEEVVVEVRQLRDEVQVLKSMIEELTTAVATDRTGKLLPLAKPSPESSPPATTEESQPDPRTKKSGSSSTSSSGGGE